jgi:polysaccharide export outer membrane protein
LKKSVISILISFCIIASNEFIHAKIYTVGVGDILEIAILQPDQSTSKVTVSPGGEISVPYLGSIRVKGKTISQIQKNIQWRLAHGYLKYPVVTVSLIESRSRNFTISGEVVNPGTYPIRANTTVLKAISIAGGFTKFGSSSRVKILRPRKDKPGYIKIKVNLKAVMDGDAEADIEIQPGDIIVVSEGFF